jgi:hypothetical protein
MLQRPWATRGLGPEVDMDRRRFTALVGAAVAGLASASRARAGDEAADTAKEPKHVCKGLNECKGQGSCKHGCGNNGCGGKNDCKGKGGCASEAARHSCQGKNSCKALGGCARGDQGCAAKNSCKGKGGCEVPLKIEHEKARAKNRSAGS